MHEGCGVHVPGPMLGSNLCKVWIISCSGDVRGIGVGDAVGSNNTACSTNMNMNLVVPKCHPLFATVWNLNLSFCMVFATFGHVHLPFCMGITTCGHVHLPFCMVFATFWHVHPPFCMGFPTCGHVQLPFCMVFATFWHVHLPFCMGCSTCEHVHPNIYRCRSLGLDKKRVGGIEGGR